MPDVRFVTCATLPAPDPDTPRLVDTLGARDVEVAVDDWRDPAVDWRTRRSRCSIPVDYVERLDEFLAWTKTLWQRYRRCRTRSH